MFTTLPTAFASVRVSAPPPPVMVPLKACPSVMVVAALSPDTLIVVSAEVAVRLVSVRARSPVIRSVSGAALVRFRTVSVFARLWLFRTTVSMLSAPVAVLIARVPEVTPCRLMV